MTITLPDEMREQLERDAKAGGFASVDEYVAGVLRADGFEDDSDANGAPIPHELRVTSRADLEAKIFEGLNSGPPVEATPELWESLRQRARAPKT
ncbi:addiction module antidote cc2985 family : Putative addiction module antidote protein, CC2985 family OS=Cylindrospermum stagnale PCC 7417 GN=Cylst_3464 PE=4 SV=1 [Gemmataceae bacterium]|nr:addiction module antidote cc2985 family : Putative addiction module antidote protein, CC2985 family OS=Cylindrospermum stagnale PCC 7417 GN=Cylst_3464 PE=4 SV=1 [Gemmataceae bacterium]VTU02301.1 addiction module antidote cc2985 family : Putative addiction module antidote protein, CC2985 family OS=Cylindrospermum stagnale PCC 7417 GN=Cylst_3464 PE=4 SV=1 [Gemmataceae bacterium]